MEELRRREEPGGVIPPGLDSQIASCRGVPGHGLGREFIVAVGAVQEGLSPLAVLSSGLDDPAKARPNLRVQGASAA